MSWEAPEQRAHPLTPGPCPPCRGPGASDLAEVPARVRRLPTSSPEHCSHSYPLGSGSSSLWAELQCLMSRYSTHLRQTAQRRTRSPGPRPVFKGSSPRRGRRHFAAARPSPALPSTASQLHLPALQAKGPPLFPDGLGSFSRGRGLVRPTLSGHAPR